MKKLALILTFALTGTAVAQTTTDVKAKAPNSAYEQDGRGVIVRSSSGLCWRTNYWTPADAVLGCDGELTPPIVNVTAPPIVPQPLAPDQRLPPPPPVVRCDFSFALESDQTFGFNSATLTNAAKVRIDAQFRSKLAACTRVDSIAVNGYTDRLGSDAFNQALSQKRAAAVADYLKQSGVNELIEPRGMGKQRALLNCDGMTILKKLINCLAPNRRVEIEVRGVSH
jgi:OOP family OmpA-OmpF porin